MKDTLNRSRRRGIYLVANHRSSEQCKNLIYSIRRNDCNLPIRIIPYGGEPISRESNWKDVEQLSLTDFPAEGMAFFRELERRIPQCNPGHLKRFLCWFGEFDEFVYTDNDIVALMNWEELFPYLDTYHIVHADTEFTTGGIFNMMQPGKFEELMGSGALSVAITAGHFLCRRSPNQLSDLLDGLAWMEAHRELPRWHDQALLHVTLALHKWPALNLCKPPHNWASSWAGDYPNPLELIRTIQVERHPISHLHYSGGIASLANPIDELLLSWLPSNRRDRYVLRALTKKVSGLAALQGCMTRGRRKVARLVKS